MITIANPLMLWGLLGLLIPMAIHLLSRKEGPVIRVGSLRHIRESSSRQFKSIKLNEIVLLLMRCILVSLLVMHLAGMRWDKLNDEKKWVVAEKGIEKDPKLRPLIDSLRGLGFEFHALANGFPKDPEQVHEMVQDYPARVEEIRRMALDSAIVLSYNLTRGFGGIRIIPPQTIRWLQVDAGTSKFVAQAIRLEGDSLRLRVGESGADETHFETRWQSWPRGSTLLKTDEDSIGIQDRKILKLTMVAEKGFEEDARIFKAITSAIQQQVPVRFVLTLSEAGKTIQPDADWLIWLSEKPAPNVGFNLMYFVKGTSSRLIRLSPSVVALVGRLDQESVLEGNLVAQLTSVFTPFHEATTHVKNLDKRSVETKMAFRETSTTRVEGKSIEGTSRVLLLTFITLLIIERVVSLYRNQ